MRDEFLPIQWTDAGTVRLLDQTRLPNEEVYLDCRTLEEIVHAIRTLQVRGAPAIGIAAAMGIALAAQGDQAETFEEFQVAVEAMGGLLRAARPTAVNLAWAVRQMLDEVGRSRRLLIPEIKRALVTKAQALCREDVAANRALGQHGQALVPDAGNVLTHCNAGGLATAGYGTAIGVIRAAGSICIGRKAAGAIAIGDKAKGSIAIGREVEGNMAWKLGGRG